MNQWITTQNELADWLQAHPITDAVALDTEFMRERTFYPQLALVQVGDRSGNAALFDPLPEIADAAKPRAEGALIQLLGDPQTTKVMHSASEDLQALQRYCDALPRPLFDTQIAAALCGMGPGVGYQALVATLLGVDLDKSQTRSDWLRRPLSEAQQHYAGEDVIHLLEAADKLQDQLQKRGRLDWLRADCERLLANADDRIDPQPQLSFRPAERMKAEQQIRLRRLLLWREQRARERDLPRTWVLDNDCLLALIHRNPSQRADFDTLLDAQKRAPRRSRDELFDLLHAEISAEERDIPLSEPQSPWLRECSKPLRQAIAELAERLEIPEGLLCNRRHAEALAASGEWPDALHGWRRDLLEPVLTPLLQAAQRQRTGKQAGLGAP